MQARTATRETRGPTRATADTVDARNDKIVALIRESGGVGMRRRILAKRLDEAGFPIHKANLTKYLGLLQGAQKIERVGAGRASRWVAASARNPG